MTANKREEGYYWVQWNRNWTITYYSYGHWWMKMARRNGLFTFAVDSDFKEIDERRITRSTPKEDGEEKQVQNVPT
jgi:hypothetical protein